MRASSLVTRRFPCGCTYERYGMEQRRHTSLCAEAQAHFDRAQELTAERNYVAASDLHHRVWRHIDRAEQRAAGAFTAVNGEVRDA